MPFFKESNPSHCRSAETVTARPDCSGMLYVPPSEQAHARSFIAIDIASTVPRCTVGWRLLWWVGAVMAIGIVLGGWIGARLTLAGGEQIVRVMVILAIAGMIVKLIWFT